MAKQATLYIRDLEHIYDIAEVERRARLAAHESVQKYDHLFKKIGEAVRGKPASMKQKKVKK